jgi:hypothetical protein
MAGQGHVKLGEVKAGGCIPDGLDVVLKPAGDAERAGLYAMKMLQCSVCVRHSKSKEVP